ncbi:MAG: xylose isomerase, partial [Methylobacteriaceae bacterium]|nr:xylose isomerase [Methylobacteriaceae bacterium]
YQSGWDTDQFPNNAAELVPAFYHLIKSGGFSTGGFNFDAKIRRQSIDPADLLYGHIGGLDVCAQALIAAAALIEDGTYDRFLAARYAGWDTPEAKAMLAGERSLADIAARVEREAIDPKPRSGRQEHLENLLNRFL